MRFRRSMESPGAKLDSTRLRIIARRETRTERESACPQVTASHGAPRAITARSFPARRSRFKSTLMTAERSRENSKSRYCYFQPIGESPKKKTKRTGRLDLRFLPARI